MVVSGLPLTPTSGRRGFTAGRRVRAAGSAAGARDGELDDVRADAAEVAAPAAQDGEEADGREAGMVLISDR